MSPGSQPGLATMIRSLQLLAIGMALIGALTPSSFGQISGRPLAVPAQVQSTPAIAPVPTQPAAPASSTTAAAENSVRQTLAAYIAAYNQKDATKLVEFFMPDGTL